VFGCATIIGLRLLQEMPPLTLIIQGMRKTNDLALGMRYIKKAFKPFGPIEAAATAQSNRGFGKSHNDTVYKCYRHTDAAHNSVSLRRLCTLCTK
jgi:hypothetical protein